jgi:hypothetical protein
MSVSPERSSVVIDSRGNAKAIHLEFQTTTTDVIEKIRLSYRQPGKEKYSDQELRLNRELLLYEASVPYSEVIEYYLTVKPEKGAAFTVGSSASPKVLPTEVLPRAIEAKQGKFKKFAIVTVPIVVGVIAVLAGLGIPKKK